jgi:hypothetical protein
VARTCRTRDWSDRSSILPLSTNYSCCYPYYYYEIAGYLSIYLRVYVCLSFAKNNYAMDYSDDGVHYLYNYYRSMRHSTLILMIQSTSPISLNHYLILHSLTSSLLSNIKLLLPSANHCIHRYLSSSSSFYHHKSLLCSWQYNNNNHHYHHHHHYLIQ